VTPEVAVFSSQGKMIYHGRIDDRFVEFGRMRPAPTTHELEDAIAAVMAGKAVPNPSAPAVGCAIPGAP
jgi:hypothetical protein